MFLPQQKLFAQHNKPQDSMMKCHWWLTNNEHHLNPKTILSTGKPSSLRFSPEAWKVNNKKIVDNILANRNVYIPSEWRPHSTNILKI
jgi:hypothetical protein